MAKKDLYENYVYEINTLLKQGELYPKYAKSILEGKNDYKLSQVYTKKNYSTEWIDTLEDCVNALDTIVRNPRKFIVIEEDIVDISLAKSVSVESVKHLAQHTNLISSVKKDGTIIPSKILNTSKEESFEIYENRFIYTLLLKTKDFLTRRFDIVKSALLQSGDLEVAVESEFNLDGQKINFKLDSAANIPFDAVVRSKSSGPSDVERLTRISNIFNDFLSSAFAKEMRSCALVRPPIQRTNVILKDPNFKKALALWQFVETSENMEFKIETSKETIELPATLSERYRGLIYLNTMLMQSIATAKEAGESYEKVLEKEKELADEYVSKNIDDFVPDDFPHLKMELHEVRKIYSKIPGAKTLRMIEVSKMNAAVDRVLRQYKINKAKEDSAIQQRLIAQQLKEEAEAKKLALREAREEERRKKREAVLAIQEAKRLARETLLAEKRAEEERIAAEKIAEEERIEAERRAEEERIEAERRAEEERIEAERIAEEERIEAERQAEEERIRKEKELEEEIKRVAAEEEARLKAELDAKLEAERLEAERLLKEEADRIAKELMEKEEKFWAERRETAIRLLVENNNTILSEEQSKAIEALRTGTENKKRTLAEIQSLLENTVRAEHERALERLVEQAKTFRTDAEIASIRANVDQTGSLTVIDARLKKELIKTQLELVKQKRRDEKLAKKKKTDVSE